MPIVESGFWETQDTFYRPPELAGFSEKKRNDPVIIVEDFLDDPHAVRELALTLDYSEPRNTPQYNAAVPDAIKDEMLRKFKAIFKKEVQLHPRTKFSATFDDNAPQAVCHSDFNGKAWCFNWTAVIYMNLPEQCRGGTKVFRHIPSGDLGNLSGQFPYYYKDALDPEKWDELVYVRMKFNRCALIPCWRWHEVEDNFGVHPDLAKARLILNPKLIVLD